MTRQVEVPGADSVAAGGVERQLGEGAYLAKTVFDRYGIAISERAKMVEGIFGLAYSAAHRRLKGQSPWTVEDLAVLAKHFGETLDEVFIAAVKTRAESATFIAGDLRLRCQVWLGGELALPPQNGLVAAKDGARWVVIAASERREGPLFQVRQLLLEPNVVVGSRIAVLDDQVSITDELCVYLRHAGFKADAYHSIRTLEAALTTLPYDGYVLDWLVGDETVHDLVETLRSTDSQTPIAILTGKANERGEVVTGIANLVTKHDLRYFSKPLDPHMITALLTRDIAAHGTR